MLENRPFRGEIYLHWNTVSQTGYVGQTTAKLYQRWCDQVKVTRWKTNAGYNYPLSRAIRKYGKDAFEHQILSVASTPEELDRLERLWIWALRTRIDGYNIKMGGEKGQFGVPHSEATKKKISQNRKGKALGNQNALGTIRSEENKVQDRLRHKGKKFSTAHNEKIRRARLGVPRPDVTAANNKRWANSEAHERASQLAKAQRARELAEKTNG